VVMFNDRGLRPASIAYLQVERTVINWAVNKQPFPMSNLRGEEIMYTRTGDNG